MMRMSVYDVITGDIVGRAGFDSLKHRAFNSAVERAIGSQSFKNKDNLIMYITDDSLSDGQWQKIAKLLKDYQCRDDTIEYGLEYDLFHDLYLTADERSVLHAGQVRFSEGKVQKKLSDIEKFLSRMIQQARHPIYRMMLEKEVG